MHVDLTNRHRELSTESGGACALVHCHKTDENLGPSDSIVGQEQYLLM